MTIEEVNFRPVQEAIYTGYEERKPVDEVKQSQTKRIDRQRLLFDAFESEAELLSPQEIDFFLKLGADPNFEEDGESVLARAVYAEASDASIGTLLKGGALPNAYEFGLILAGAEDLEYIVEIAEYDDLNLLEHFLSKDPLDNHAVLALVNAGANLEFEIHGQSPLDVAKAHGASDKVISAMIIHGAVDLDVSLENVFAKEPLDSEVANALVNQGMSLDFTVNGNSPLAVAIEKGASPELIQAMILSGVDLDNKNGSLDAPVFLAARKFDIDTLDLLFEAGADFNANLKDPYPPGWGHLADNLLKQYKMDYKEWIQTDGPMLRAIAKANGPNGSWSAFDTLIKMGFDPYNGIETHKIGNLLSWSICAGLDTETIRRLVNDKGYDLSKSYTGWNPRFEAKNWGRDDVLEFLNSKITR